MLFNTRNAAFASLVALAAMASGAFAAPFSKPIRIDGNGIAAQDETLAARGFKPNPPNYYCLVNGPQPLCN